VTNFVEQGIIYSALLLLSSLVIKVSVQVFDSFDEDRDKQMKAKRVPLSNKEVFYETLHDTLGAFGVMVMWFAVVLWGAYLGAALYLLGYWVLVWGR